MRLYDVDEQEQTLTDDTPVFDNSQSGQRVSSEKFGDFKL